MRTMHFSGLSLQLFIIDILLTPLSLLIASQIRILLPFGKELHPEAARLPFTVYLLAIVCWMSALVLNRAYDPQRVLRWYHEAMRVISSAVAATIFMAGALYMTYREVSRLQFVYFFVINLGLLLGYRALLRLYYRSVGRARPGKRSRTLIVGAGDLGQKVAKVLLDHSRWGFALVGFLDDNPAKQGQKIIGASVLGKLDDLRTIVEKYQVVEVWIALPARAYERVNQIVSEVETLPVRIKIIPDYFSLAMIRAKSEILGGIPLIGLREPVIEGMPRIIKRIFDLVVAIFSLIILSPILALITLFIRLESPGPVIFHQKRVGENGVLFDMLKFRTMVVGAEAKQEELAVETETGEMIYKQKDDPRVTQIGRFLRRYSLDELPQLVNVVRGEMSLVGPRPEMPWLVDKYDAWQRKRFAVPQGITGWWQINGRGDKPMHLNTEDDLYYVYNYSLWLDIQILLRTPWAVLSGRGAF